MQATADLIRLALANQDAISWYADAQREIETICQLENWRSDYFTGILAVTSPRVACRRNIRIALQYCGTGRFLSNVMRTIKKSVATFEESGEILGPKTSAFAAALRGDPHAVVLDVHMANLLGVRQSIAFRRKGEIAHWTTTIRETAAACGMEARAAQACLWFGHKRAIGENPEAFPIVAEYNNWIGHNREFPKDGAIMSDYCDDTF